MEDLTQIARLLRERNGIDAQISKLTGRPATLGHIGEYIASVVFNIRLNVSAAQKGSDGVFQEGWLAGSTVNVKYYAKQDGLLDLNVGAPPDYYLVLTGPTAPAKSSRGDIRPTVIEHVYLFNRIELAKDVETREVKNGIATSIRKEYWERSEIFPRPQNAALPLTSAKRLLLAQFSSDAQIASSKTEKSTTETVLEVGYEGGVASIVRFRGPNGAWWYRMGRDESAAADLLSDEDMEGISAREQSESVRTFGAALALLGKWPWEALELVTLNPQYTGIVLAEVGQRGGEKQVTRWREMLDRLARNRKSGY